MSAVSANSAVFARKAVAGKAIASKRTATKARAAFSVSANAKVDACDKNSVIVSPSILSANFATLGAEVSWQTIKPQSTALLLCCSRRARAKTKQRFESSAC